MIKSSLPKGFSALCPWKLSLGIPHILRAPGLEHVAILKELGHLAFGCQQDPWATLQRRKTWVEVRRQEMCKSAQKGQGAAAGVEPPAPNISPHFSWCHLPPATSQFFGQGSWHTSKSGPCMVIRAAAAIHRGFGDSYVSMEDCGEGIAE